MVSHVGGWDPSTRAITCCLPWCVLTGSRTEVGTQALLQDVGIPGGVLIAVQMPTSTLIALLRSEMTRKEIETVPDLRKWQLIKMCSVI